MQIRTQDGQVMYESEFRAYTKANGGPTWETTTTEVLEALGADVIFGFLPLGCHPLQLDRPLVEGVGQLAVVHEAGDETANVELQTLHYATLPFQEQPPPPIDDGGSQNPDGNTPPGLD